MISKQNTKRMDFVNWSYQAHSKSYSDLGESYWNVANSADWPNGKTIDVWRHKRMIEVIDPFLDHYKKSKWLMIGDGRYGTSSIYAKMKSARAVPLDIDTSLLEESKKAGIIDEYINGNAESIPIEDDSMDFCFCKESFHHFPRPFQALYEMIRCSKEAVILTEPCDWIPQPIPRRIGQIIKRSIQKLVGLNVNHSDSGNYEAVGNYIYTISKREFEKVALAINLPAYGYKKFHDIYEEGVETEKALSSSDLFRKIIRKIAVNSILSRLGLTSKNRISIILFKQVPEKRVVEDLKKLKFKVVNLPSNPNWV